MVQSQCFYIKLGGRKSLDAARPASLGYGAVEMCVFVCLIHTFILLGVVAHLCKCNIKQAKAVRIKRVPGQQGLPNKNNSKKKKITKQNPPGSGGAHL